MRFAWLVGVVAACATACDRSHDPGASCGAAAARWYVLGRDALAAASVDDAARRSVVDTLMPLRVAVEQVCEADAWSRVARACMATASDAAAWQTCELQLTPAQRDGLDRRAVIAPVTP